MEEQIYNAHFDGSTRPRDKRSTIGFIIQSADKKTLCRSYRPVDYGNSIEVEYKALIELLKTAIGLQIKRINIIGDCKTVIDKLNGHSSVGESLRPYNEKCLELLGRLDYYQLQWVRRHHNHVADRLSRKSLNPK